EGATVFGYWVNDPERYGVAEFDASGKVVGIEEKPAQPRSSYAVTGLYFYDGKAPDYAAELKPSARGELEITDLNKRYLDDGTLYGAAGPRLCVAGHRHPPVPARGLQLHPDHPGPAGPAGVLPGGYRLRQWLDRRGPAGGTGGAAGQERVWPVPARTAEARSGAMK